MCRLLYVVGVLPFGLGFTTPPLTGPVEKLVRWVSGLALAGAAFPFGGLVGAAFGLGTDGNVLAEQR